MSKTMRIVLFGCVGLILALFASYVYIAQARVVGYEFDPQTWQIRHFEFYADPFTNKELIGVDRTGKVNWTINPTITALLTPGASSKWDLIELNDYRPEKSVGPAAIIVDALTTRRSGWSSTSVEFWPDWSTKNPTEAALFWKAVQSLTIHGAYNDVPELLEVAVTNTSKIPELSNRLVADALLRRANQLQSDGEAAQAKAAATEGLRYAPSSVELKKIVDGK
ncbi:MAG: hypothetical protein U0930_15055 [Pirellulales bacterium]